MSLPLLPTGLNVIDVNMSMRSGDGHLSLLQHIGAR